MYSNDDYLLDLLTEAGNLTQDEVGEALANKGRRTALEYLIETNRVSEEVVAQTMAVNSGMEFADLSGFVPDPGTLELMDAEVANKYHVLPVSFDGSRLALAVADPLDFQTMDSLPHLVPYALDFFCAPKSQITQFLVEFYGYQKDAGGGLEIGSNASEGSATEADAPIIKLVTELLQEAVNSRASDIHVEPLEKRLRIRYRIDGVLQESASHPKHLHAPILARLKIMTAA